VLYIVFKWLKLLDQDEKYEKNFSSLFLFLNNLSSLFWDSFFLHLFFVYVSFWRSAKISSSTLNCMNFLYRGKFSYFLFSPVYRPENLIKNLSVFTLLLMFINFFLLGKMRKYSREKNHLTINFTECQNWFSLIFTRADFFNAEIY
jgi:hypothetical protein